MHLSSVKAHRGVVHTPLRYPGGKTRLTGFLRRVVEGGGWTDCTYVEPYAGGAGAALSLLHDQVVPRVVINDLDPHIHAFWVAVTNHSKQFLAKFDDTALTLDEWHVQRDVYRAGDASDAVGLGFATFFLNRTNRSGIMNAGVIGGQAQAGRYKLDARFNREILRQKLAWIGQQSDCITVSNRDGLEVIAKSVDSERDFCYIDPPYYDKGSDLYMNSFAEAGHAALADVLRSARAARWVLTYDDVPQIRKLYAGMYQGTFSLPYSAHTASLAKERMILSDAVADVDGVMD
ncbi:DNA adenine methylase [Desertihabitans brevis]|uniref:site-specific DNA-methyltransferase (adenine-specific) n=1 Tax=Desertihabitans brevis TaxID=2268447 RepID=A0A367YY04_9ACTN|nr:DNA adenine methylase [Desertihabitans brevis]RCK70409.1 DNA adenine methylase [Desertihabitans brevis]